MLATDRAGLFKYDAPAQVSPLCNVEFKVGGQEVEGHDPNGVEALRLFLYDLLYGQRQDGGVSSGKVFVELDVIVTRDVSGPVVRVTSMNVEGFEENTVEQDRIAFVKLYS